MALTTSCDPVQPEPLDQACGRQDRPRALMGVSPLNPEMFVYIYILYMYTQVMVHTVIVLAFLHTCQLLLFFKHLQL